MPKFDEAIIQRTQNDITQEIAFLRGVSVGERVFLTLSDGERSNRVMRSLNAAAKQLQVRLARIKSPQTEVIFRSCQSRSARSSSPKRPRQSASPSRERPAPARLVPRTSQVRCCQLVTPHL